MTRILSALERRWSRITRRRKPDPPPTHPVLPSDDHQEGQAMSQSETQPPTSKYRLTVTIRGNTLDEIEDELFTQTRGGFLLDSDYHKRDSWHSTSGRVTSVMEHTNPEMTPERYTAELHAWATDQKASR